MGELRIEPSKTTEWLVDTFARVGVVLPLARDQGSLGVLVDAAGEALITIDVNRDRTDDDVEVIAMLIELAVNTCGGFRAERVETSADDDRTTEEQAGETPACPPNSDAPAVAAAGVSDPAAQSEPFARGTTETGTGD